MNVDILQNTVNTVAADIHASSSPISSKDLYSKIALMEKFGYCFAPYSRDALCAYLEGYSIRLSGTVGTGKTLFFQTLNKCGIANLPVFIWNVQKKQHRPISEIEDEILSHSDCEMLIDDIGSENEKMEYGNRISIVSQIVVLREDSLRRTHYTTNLTRNELLIRYGDRVASRLKCCKSFAFVGEDRRSAQPNTHVLLERWTANNQDQWILCAERCANYDTENIYCRCGVVTPPAYHPRPLPPEECPSFLPLSKTGNPIALPSLIKS